MAIADLRFAKITCEFEPPVARIALHNPPRNVIDLAMMEELAQALAEAEARREISVVIFSGRGKSFSAGVDAAAHLPGQAEAMLARFHDVIRKLAASRTVSIAAVHGHCLGGAAELAMMCDLAYTTEMAQWGFPEVKLGCFPPVASAALAAIIGQKYASDLILSGRSITGLEAAALRLVNRAVPEGRLADAVEESVARLAKMSPVVLELAKKSIYAWDSIHFDKGLARAEKIYLDELVKLEDAQEGIEAFVGKREPKWKGK
jgi:cyclohexa-1,5-dienecarbonyl-CoA hydratase